MALSRPLADEEGVPIDLLDEESSARRTGGEPGVHGGSSSGRWAAMGPSVTQRLPLTLLSLSLSIPLSLSLHVHR